jgi:flagellar basal body-associated protein FliL
LLQIIKMPKRNIKSFKFVKLVLLMLCVVIVLTVITVGLVILWSQKSKESTPKRNESMPEEKHFKSILSLIINSYFFV